MSVNMPLYAKTGKDMRYKFQITLDGVPLDITDLDIIAHLKDNSAASDNGLGTATYLVGLGLTKLNAATGMVQLDIPHEDIGGIQQIRWWRLDVVDPLDSTNGTTAVEGIFSIIAV